MGKSKDSGNNTNLQTKSSKRRSFGQLFVKFLFILSLLFFCDGLVQIGKIFWIMGMWPKTEGVVASTALKRSIKRDWRKQWQKEYSLELSVKLKISGKEYMGTVPIDLDFINLQEASQWMQKFPTGQERQFYYNDSDTLRVKMLAFDFVTFRKSFLSLLWGFCVLVLRDLIKKWQKAREQREETRT